MGRGGREERVQVMKYGLRNRQLGESIEVYNGLVLWFDTKKCGFV